MAAAKISKEHGPQDPNGTADPGQTDPRTRPKTPDPTTAPEVLIMLPAATTSYASYTQATEVTLLFTTTVSHCNAKNTVRVATPDITLGALIY